MSVRAVLSVFLLDAQTAERRLRRPSETATDGAIKYLGTRRPQTACVCPYPHGKNDVLTSAHAPISAGEFEFQTVEQSGGCRTYVQKVTISVDFMSVC